MGTWSWVLIGVSSGLGLAAGGTLSTVYFAKLIWWNKRLVRRPNWNGVYEWRPASRYDDSSYKYRDAPHGDDIWYGFLLTLVFFVSYPVWGINRFVHRRRKKSIKKWEAAKFARSVERDEQRRIKAEADKIIAELNRGGNA